MYDIIGDIHGCYAEWQKLIQELGYSFEKSRLHHPDGRQLIVLGDLTDRGPQSLAVLEAICDLTEKGDLLYVPGNHCDKLYRYFLGRPVKVQHGLETTVNELDGINAAEKKKLKERFMKLYEKAPLYLILDRRRLVVAHAGIPEHYIGHFSNRVKSFVLYGETTGQTDSHGRPERIDWAKHYHGSPWVIYGHTPVSKPRIIHHTANIDTGCVFGGALTAFRYPEMTTLSIPSEQPVQSDRFRVF